MLFETQSQCTPWLPSIYVLFPGSKEAISITVVLPYITETVKRDRFQEALSKYSESFFETLRNITCDKVLIEESHRPAFCNFTE